ncbi:DUF4234 domain-containing protein [Candidatus Woesearchaeota archaeon]|nr:DUF4234 domain-containing protein [Candidatus Woesearchaeota archaeon]
MKEKYSNKFPIKKLIILSIVTLGIYEIYWLYRNWKYIKETAKKDIHPKWRTLGLIVPLYGIWLIYDQFRTIIKLANQKKVNTKFSAGDLTAVYIGLTLIDNRLSWKLPDQYWYFSLVFTVLALLPLIAIQKYFNGYWDKTQKSPEKTDFSIGEVVWIIVGVIFWAVMFLL